MVNRRRTPARALRGYIWIDTLLRTLDLSPAEFARLYLEDDDSQKSGLIYKWLNGAATPTRRSVARIASYLPGSDFIYSIPLFDLLDSGANFSRLRLAALLKSLSNPDGAYQRWNDVVFRGFAPVEMSHFSELWAFQGELCKLRSALIVEAPEAFIVGACKGASRLVRLSRAFGWVGRHFDELSLVFNDLIQFSSLSCVGLQVDWERLKATQNREGPTLTIAASAAEAADFAVVVDIERLNKLINH